MKRIPFALALLLCGGASSLAAQAGTRINVCVVAGGKLQEVAAQYDPATGDTTVSGRSFAAAYPSAAPHYSAAQPWYVNNQPIAIAGKYYLKYGLPRILSTTDVVPSAALGTVPLFAEPGTAAPAEVLYAPVRTGCEFQPYQMLPAVVGEVNVGAARTGTLVHDDPKDDENHHYESWLLRGRAGEVVEISLESEDFDAYVSLQGNGLSEQISNDDGGDDLDARLEVALPRDGLYEVVASTADGEEIGDYTLRVTRPSWAASLATRRVLDWGAQLRGSIVGADIQDGGRKYQEFLYSAVEEEATTFALSSDEFDPKLSIGRIVGSRFVELAADDARGDGDSRLAFEFSAPGVYVLRVEAADRGNGAYTLSAGVLPTITLGVPASGELTESDPEVDDERFVDEFLYEAAAGESVVIDLESEDFDAVVYVGEEKDTGFEVLKADDDGGEGVDSRLELTFVKGGTYYIGVTTAEEHATGEYTLRIRAR